MVSWFTEKIKTNVTDGAKQKLGKALRAHKFLRIKKFNRYVYKLKQKGSETEVSDESLKGGAYELIG